MPETDRETQDTCQTNVLKILNVKLELDQISLKIFKGLQTRFIKKMSRSNKGETGPKLQTLIVRFFSRKVTEMLVHSRRYVSKHCLKKTHFKILKYKYLKNLFY